MRTSKRWAWVAGLAIALATGAGVAGAQDAGVKASPAVAAALSKLPKEQQPLARHALLIGIDRYDNKDIPVLPACVNDVKAVRDVLTGEEVGGLFPAENVHVLLNEQATRKNILQEFERLRREVGPEDLVVVFFSGHGAVDEAGGKKRAYWVTYDTDLKALRASALASTDVNDCLDQIKTTRLVALVDACFSAATARVGAGVAKGLVIPPDPAKTFAGGGRVVMTSSKGEQQSVVVPDPKDPTVQRSAFTLNLVEGMRGAADVDGNGAVEVDELWDYVKDRTARVSRKAGGDQEPQMEGRVEKQFLLTVNGPALIVFTERRATAEQAARARAGRLEQLFLAKKLTAAQYDEAQSLLAPRAEPLTAAEEDRKRLYAAVGDGTLDPYFLPRLLASSEAGSGKPVGEAATGERKPPVENRQQVAVATPTVPAPAAPAAVAPVPARVKTPIEELTDRATAGDAGAMFELAGKYAAGDGIGRSDARAFEWYLKAARGGSALGMFNAAVMYDNGLGTGENPAEAARWYASALGPLKQAAGAGDEKAMFALGQMYGGGLGIAADHREAIRWYRPCADRGNVRAMYWLGWLYATPDVDDPVASRQWYKKAADRGDADAKAALEGA